MKVKVERMTTGSWGKVRAFVDINFCGVVIKGFKIIEGINGLFLGYPSQKDKDDSTKYNNTIYVDDDVVKASLEKTAIDYYNSDTSSIDDFHSYNNIENQPKRMIGGMSEVDRINNSTDYADKDEGTSDNKWEKYSPYYKENNS